METTFLLQLDHNESLNFVIDISLFEKSLGKTILVESLKHILFLDVSEQLNNLVDSVV